MEPDEPKPRRTRNYTLVALFGLFVVAALIALGSRLLPGGASGIARKLLGGNRDDNEG